MSYDGHVYARHRYAYLPYFLIYFSTYFNETMTMNTCRFTEYSLYS